MVALLHQNRSASSSSSPLRGLLYLGVVALFLVALKHAAGGFDLSWSGTRQGQQQTSTQEAKVLKEALELEQPADKGQADAGVQAAFSSIYAGRTWGQDGNGSGEAHGARPVARRRPGSERAFGGHGMRMHPAQTVPPLSGCTNPGVVP